MEKTAIAPNITVIPPPRGGVSLRVRGGRAIEAESLKGILVLLEPDENVRDALLTLLQGRGWSIETAGDVRGLESLLQGLDVAAVISEASLPGCRAGDILRVCERQQVPVIFTGHDLPVQGAVDLIRQGAQDFLDKPFQQERLLDLLNHLPNRHNT
jgi:DNA-binding NtrC family response regulator